METIKEGHEFLELNQRAVTTLQEGFRSKYAGSKLDIAANISDDMSKRMYNSAKHD